MLVWRCITLATVCGTLAAAAWECPAECACAGAGETLLTCGGIEYKVRDDGYVEVDCQGGELSCSAVPPLPHPRTLRHLELVQCSVARGAGGCVSTAVGGPHGGPPKFYTKNLVNNLTEESFEGLEGIEELVMHGASVQQSLPPISHLPHLSRFIFVEGHLSAGLSPSLPPSLTYLEFINSGLTSLSRSSFEGLGQLHTLHVYNNPIETLTYTDLQPLVSLRVLSVMFSPVTRVQLSPLVTLEDVSLVRVRMQHLYHRDLSDMPELKQLTIKSVVPLTLHPLSLSSLPSLTSLRVSESGVSSLPPDLFTNTTSLVNLTLAWNSIQELPDSVFYNMSMLERLELSHNSIRSLRGGVFDSLASLREVTLDHNLIQTLPLRLFSLCTSLQRVSLSHNRLTSVPSPTFPPSLTHLYLAYNMLSGPSPTVGAPPDEYWVDQFVPSPFNSLLNLQVLDLSHNNISYMYADLRQVLVQNLRYLDLSYNNFTELMESDTHFMNLNITVDLTHNRITRVEPHFRPSPSPSSPTTSQSILLSHNPFSCDCQLFPLVKYLERTAYSVQGAQCFAPPALARTPLTALRLDDLYCPFTPDVSPEAPPDCTCLYRPNRDRYECTCSRVHVEDLPDPTRDGVSHLSLRLTARNDFKFLPDFVNELNVSGVGLTEFHYNVSKVEVLDLSYNNLGRIPLELLRGNHSLYLRGNPVECDCWNSEFVFELQKNSERVLDYRLMSCSNQVRVSVVDASSLCDVYTASIVGSSLAVIGILVAVFISLCWRYKVDIKGYLSTIPGLEFLDDEDIEGKEYDIFVSFSHEDFPFMRDVLLPVLDGSYRVCVHYREWEVGQAIPLQIHRSVVVSRRTLVLLSRHYVKSRWAVAEFREAAANGRLLLLLLEDVDTDLLPADLRDYISTTTYLQVSDTRFWDKLRRALPRRPLKATPTAGDSTPVGVTPGDKVTDPKSPVIDVILNEHGQLVNKGYVKDV